MSYDSDYDSDYESDDEIETSRGGIIPKALMKKLKEKYADRKNTASFKKLFKESNSVNPWSFFLKTVAKKAPKKATKKVTSKLAQKENIKELIDNIQIMKKILFITIKHETKKSHKNKLNAITIKLNRIRDNLKDLI